MLRKVRDDRRFGDYWFIVQVCKYTDYAGREEMTMGLAIVALIVMPDKSDPAATSRECLFLPSSIASCESLFILFYMQSCCFWLKDHHNI